MKKFLLVLKNTSLFNLYSLLSLYLFACLSQKTLNINAWNADCLDYVCGTGCVVFIVSFLINNEKFN
jgi:hypothetical protein